MPGKTKRVALVASMSKPLIILDAMVSSGRHWDSQRITPRLPGRLL